MAKVAKKATSKKVAPKKATPPKKVAPKKATPKKAAHKKVAPKKAAPPAPAPKKSAPKKKGAKQGKAAREAPEREVINLERAMELTGLDQDDLRSAGVYNTTKIFFYPGAVKVTGDFVIKERTAAIVEGDLDVGHDVVQEDLSGLIVRGQLRARNFLSFSGADVRGAVTLTGVLFGSSLCDHELSAETIKAKAVIDDGHTFNLRRRSIRAMTIGTMHHGGEMKDPDYGPDALEQVFAKDVMKGARLNGKAFLTRLRRGVPVFKV